MKIRVGAYRYLFLEEGGALVFNVCYLTDQLLVHIISTKPYKEILR
jgi:hypothetical protein